MATLLKTRLLGIALGAGLAGKGRYELQAE